MFCPQCKAEYRPGFTHCSDCDVDLVEELSESGTKSREDLRVVWKGDNQTDCVDVCLQLRDSGIRYDVLQEVTGLAPAMDVDWRYKVRVSSREYGRAKEVLATDWPPTAYESNDESAFQLPASQSSAPGRTEEQYSSRGKWRPSDATIEVWSQKAHGASPMVELSLKTNSIPFRAQTNDQGTRRFFVLPRDEARAREIIRQIQDGAPPE